ncbi:MAG: VWA domain-containing protein [Thermoanaerobaculia bacterium]|nr:VWA domain-containing protein [Thermoanaerobaculia bacterium]
MPAPVRLLTLLTLIAALEALPQPRVRETIDVRIIEVDVIVTDAAGQRVHGLTAVDFEAFEDRKRQEITNFTEYRAHTRDEILDAASPLPAREPHSLLVLVDSLPREGLVRRNTLESVQALIARTVAGGDRVGLVFWEPVLERATTIVELTENRDDVARAIESWVRGGSTPAAPDDSEIVKAFFERGARATAVKGGGIVVAGEMAASDRFAATADLIRLRRKTAAMRQIVASLGTGAGKKTVLYVSNGFSLPSNPQARQSAIAMLEDLAKAANAAGVTFYAAHPATPETTDISDLSRRADALSRLTEPTGGRLELGLSSPSTVGRQIEEDRNTYYSLAYRARSDDRDRERRIRVKTKNPAYRVRVRDSIVEKSNETMARDALLARLFTGNERNDVEFAIREDPPRESSRGRWLLPLVITIAAAQLRFEPEGRDQVALLKILIVAANGVAEVTNIHEDTLRVVAGKDSPAGLVKYSVTILGDRRGSQLSIGVFDVRTGLVGVRTLDNRNRLP